VARQESASCTAISIWLYATNAARRGESAGKTGKTRSVSHRHQVTPSHLQDTFEGEIMDTTTVTTTTPLFVVADDTYTHICAQAIADRVRELIDLDKDNSPRNRACWNALVDADEAFRQLYRVNPFELIGA
jgi:hypothetical protein